MNRNGSVQISMRDLQHMAVQRIDRSLRRG
jgi:hypothetical protein